jgi:hypothetical protein
MAGLFDIDPGTFVIGTRYECSGEKKKKQKTVNRNSKWGMYEQAIVVVRR